VAVQRQLVGRLLTLAAAFDGGRLPNLSLPPRYVAAKLARGVPALTGEPIPVPAALIRPTLLGLCDDLAEGGAGDAARRIKAALVETRIDAGSLLTASLLRHQPSIRTAAAHHDLAADLLWFIAELATSPFAHALQQKVFARANEEGPLRDAVIRWEHGDCPACGSWPALAEIVAADDGRRVLRCSFCACGWTPDPRCAYCGNRDERFVVATPDGGRPERRVEVCGACGSYLKAVEVEHLSPFPLLAVADLETSDLDSAALARGYSRPSAGVRPGSDPGPNGV
jgi:FdhE protein